MSTPSQTKDKLSEIFDMPVQSDTFKGALKEFLRAKEIKTYAFSPEGEALQTGTKAYARLVEDMAQSFAPLGVLDVDGLHSAGLRVRSVSVDTLDQDFVINATVQGEKFPSPKQVSIVAGYGPQQGSYLEVQFPKAPGEFLKDVVNSNLAGAKGNFVSPDHKESIPLRHVAALLLVATKAEGPAQGFGPSHPTMDGANNTLPHITRHGERITFYTEDPAKPTAARQAQWVKQALSEGFTDISIQRGETTHDFELKRVFRNEPYKLEFCGMRGLGSALGDGDKVVDKVNADVLKAISPVKSLSVER